ncbi:amino acid ABC transporter ATP-binding protein [Azospirillum doebereinerae]
MTMATTPTDDIVLRVEDLHKSFGDNTVLTGIDLSVRRGERIAILGSSGSGKSTLLRCLNVLEMPSKGRLFLDGEAIGKPASNGATRYREAELNRLRARVGMVFQQFNLFPHMTALENVMEGPLSVLGHSRAEAAERARRHLAQVGLAEKADSHPARLSGGQQQRVAIARALAMDPEVLLFDEPTSSLDPELVGEVLSVIRDLSEEGRTMLLVTHELGFAYHFATRVLFLHEGRILEDGPPEQVLKNPREERTRRFLDRFTAFRI